MCFQTRQDAFLYHAYKSKWIEDLFHSSVKWKSLPTYVIIQCAFLIFQYIVCSFEKTTTFEYIYIYIPQGNLYSTCIKRTILTLFSTSMISRKESRNLWEITRLISSIFHVSKESDYWTFSGTIGNKIWKEKVSAIWYLLASNFILFLQNGKICQNFLFL